MKTERSRLLRLTLMSTFFTGLVAYGYVFLNFLPSHDSLNEFFMDASWQISLGRFLVPVYQEVLGMTMLTPLTGGLVGLVWIALAAYLAVRMFELSSGWAVCLTAAAFTANITVIALSATYMPWFGPDLLAVGLAVGAAWCWKRACQAGRGWKYSALGAGLMVMTLGLYQSQLSVTIVLIMVFSIRQLLRGKSCERAVFFNGLRAIGMIAAAGAAYLAAVRGVLAATGQTLQTGEYNSLANLWRSGEPVASRVWECYAEVVKAFLLTPGYAYPRFFLRCVHGLMILMLGAGGIGLFFREKRSVWGNGMLIALAALLPAGMNFSRLLNPMTHDLMRFGYWMLYFMVILVGGEFTRVWWRRAASALLCLVLLSHVQTANRAGMKKSFEQQATLSLMTRVMDRVELTDGYVPGETPVALIGTPRPALNEGEEYGDLRLVTGMDARDVISRYGVYQEYFDHVLKRPVCVKSIEEAQALSEDAAVKAMPVFPEKGSVQNVEGTVVVKFR